MEEYGLSLISRCDVQNSKVLVFLFDHDGSLGVGLTEDRLGDILFFPPLGFFWDEVFLEAFCPLVDFARWNCGSGLAAAVVAAAAVAAFFFCTAAVL